MNIVIFEDKDISSENKLIIKNELKVNHILNILKLQKGDELKIGKLNGLIGKGIITEINKNDGIIKLEFNLYESPPEKLKTTLILAMVRPKTLIKSLHSAISLGVKEIIIIKTWRVEKSFWASPILNHENLKKIAVESLEQAKDTVLPNIEIRKLFKPFIEDELKLLIKNKRGIVAHPIANRSFFDKNENLDNVDYIAIGPEGGFIEYEIEKFKEIGFEVFKLNKRILRVENAVGVILSRLINI